MFRLHPHQHGKTWIREAQLNLGNFLTLLTQLVLALRAEPQPPVNERQRGKWKPRSGPLSFRHAWPRPMKLPTSRFPANPIGNHGQQCVGARQAKAVEVGSSLQASCMEGCKRGHKRSHHKQLPCGQAALQRPLRPSQRRSASSLPGCLPFLRIQVLNVSTSASFPLMARLATDAADVIIKLSACLASRMSRSKWPTNLQTEATAAF